MDGVLSTSHVANSFMGTGLMPSPKMVCFSAMTVESGAQHKGVWDACLGASTHVVGASLPHTSYSIVTGNTDIQSYVWSGTVPGL